MPTTYGNANYRKKFDAFRVIDQSGHEPLAEAITVAMEMRQEALNLSKAIDTCSDQETRSKLILAQSKALPDQFNAWIKIAEFVYSKPRHIEVSGHMTLEQLLAGTWDQSLNSHQDAQLPEKGEC